LVVELVARFSRDRLVKAQTGRQRKRQDDAVLPAA